jgi:hypothetical protein
MFKLEKGNIGFIIDKLYVLCFFIFEFAFWPKKSIFILTRITGILIDQCLGQNKEFKRLI